MQPNTTPESARVLIEVLRLDKVASPPELRDIAVKAKTTESFAKKVLRSCLGEEVNLAALSPRQRVQLAVEIARAGRLRDAARVLTWQEFEDFSAECLEEAGFRTEKNVKVRGDGRRWQIDVVGLRGDLALAIDCKHWSTPSYTSKLKPYAEHQTNATAHFLATRTERPTPQGLAVVLTLAEPPSHFLDKAVLVSVEKLPSFLSAVTPFDPNLPLIFSLPVVENPIS